MVSVVAVSSAGNHSSCGCQTKYKELAEMAASSFGGGSMHALDSWHQTLHTNRLYGVPGYLMMRYLSETIPLPLETTSHPAHHHRNSITVVSAQLCISRGTFQRRFIPLLLFCEKHSFGGDFSSDTTRIVSYIWMNCIFSSWRLNLFNPAEISIISNSLCFVNACLGAKTFSFA